MPVIAPRAMPTSASAQPSSAAYSSAMRALSVSQRQSAASRPSGANTPGTMFVLPTSTASSITPPRSGSGGGQHRGALGGRPDGVEAASDRAAGQHHVAVVEDDRLAGRDRALRRQEAHGQTAIGGGR